MLAKTSFCLFHLLKSKKKNIHFDVSLCCFRTILSQDIKILRRGGHLGRNLGFWNLNRKKKYVNLFFSWSSGGNLSESVEKSTLATTKNTILHNDLHYWKRESKGPVPTCPLSPMKGFRSTTRLVLAGVGELPTLVKVKVSTQVKVAYLLASMDFLGVKYSSVEPPELIWNKTNR